MYLCNLVKNDTFLKFRRQVERYTQTEQLGTRYILHLSLYTCVAYGTGIPCVVYYGT